MIVTYERPSNRQGALIAHLSGSFKALAADKLWDAVSQQIDEETRFVILDFTGVSLVASAGLGMLVRLYTRLQGLGGGLAVYGCSDKIRGIIHIVMLTDILKVCANETEAWEALQS